MKRWALRLALAGIALALVAVLVAWSGRVSVAASASHNPLVAWFLHFTMRQAVQKQSRGIEVPPLSDPQLIVLGAGVYSVACASCHGAPGEPAALAAQNMTPPTPWLPPTVGEWKPHELFWIVKHGLKYTAMPGWAAQRRDDEVWAVVAFLLKLPQLDVAGYRELAYGETQAFSAAVPASVLGDPLGLLVDTCARCHGLDGLGRDGVAPAIAGQSEVYLFETLLAYAGARRLSGIMQPLAASLAESTMRRLAAHYASLPAAATTDAASGAQAAGRNIAYAGIPEQDVPPCLACHGPGTTPRADLYPDLAGQDADYLALQLRLFREGRRGGSAAAPLMEAIARQLKEDQAQAVARWYAGLSANAETP